MQISGLLRFGYFTRIVYLTNTKLILDRFVLTMTVADAILPLVCQHINIRALTYQTH